MDNLYDEFGNYVGPIEEQAEEAIDVVMDETYGAVETLVEEEDTQPITEPIIAPVKVKDFDLVEKEPPEVTFSYDFLSGLMYKPELVRHVCFIGHYQHGKTSLIDRFVKETHLKDWKLHKEYRYLDSRRDEVNRSMSVKAKPISLVLQNSQDKSYLINIIDTPGHTNFSDEVVAAVRLCDGAVVVVDALEGVMLGTNKVIEAALRERLSIAVVINSIDRLILELRLPPQDAYHKLRHIIEEVNNAVQSVAEGMGLDVPIISPTNNNVAFASATKDFTFTLKSFANIYSQYYPAIEDPELLAKCLWGDYYYVPSTRTFSKTPPSPGAPRTFVEFVLEPLYKIMAYCVAEEQHVLAPVLADLGVYIHKSDYDLDTTVLIKKVCGVYFMNTSALVDMIIDTVPSPAKGARSKIECTYSGDMENEIVESMDKLEDKSQLMFMSSKTYHSPDCETFDVYGRVMSGTLAIGQRVRVLGEGYSPDDEEDSSSRIITDLWIYQGGRYRIQVSHVPAGNLVLVGGIEAPKTATVTTSSSMDGVEIFRPLKFDNAPVFKIATEPLVPSELPKMLEGIRKIEKTYPSAKTKVEESGEHVIFGTGELYLDTVLHDLRKVYGDLEIKVADPVVQFGETVVDKSTMRCYAETANKQNKIHMLAEPLEKGLGAEIEKGTISLSQPQTDITEFFKSGYSWDKLSTKSIWAFGPDTQGPNILMDFTLRSSVNQEDLHTVKDSIIQGFRWVTREGPLIEEQIRNTKFKILDVTVSDDPLLRGGSQIIPAARRVAYSSFLLATPHILEPQLYVEILCPADCVAAIYTVLQRRRGHVVRDAPKAGTPFFVMNAYIPAIDSYGFDTDMRTHTSGQAFCMSVFDSYVTVPGDPLDKSIMLRPLEPAPRPHLAREFLLKTRRRKGLSEDVMVHKFFDDAMLLDVLK